MKTFFRFQFKRTLALLLVALSLSGASLANDARDYVNQDLGRPEGWQRIVEKSDFALGDRKEIGTSGDVTLYERGYGSYPSIDGSTVSLPMALECARQHLSLGEQDLEGFVFLSTTHSAYEHLILKQPNGSAMIPSQGEGMDAAHPVDLILVTPPSQEEMSMAEAANVQLVMKPVCYDAFVFITHADNPVQSLTVRQIQDIYSGTITNWKAVDGQDQPIAAYQRPVNSGSQTAMIELVMQGQPLAAAKENYVVPYMDGLVERIGEYENNTMSIGYTYQFYLDSLYRGQNIKVLAVEGITPDPQNLRSGQYPFTTNYFAVIRGGEEKKVGGRFQNWLVSKEGQRCLKQAGYIPMNEP